MGFVPLVPKTYLTRCTALGLLKLIWKEKTRFRWQPGRIAFGEFHDVAVSDRPKPEDMQTVVLSEVPNPDRITLWQDEDFFRWRFDNTRKTYVFYYWRTNHVTRGYMVVGVSLITGRGYILDYAQTEDTAIENILRYALKMKHFPVLSIDNFGLSDSFSETLARLHFKRNSLIRTIERRIKGELPLLLRPVRRKYVESDFFVKGMDTRKVENWKIKGICADDA
jgi:hypothetical protein